MEITEDYAEARSQRLREFNVVVKTLLSRQERQILYMVLKDFKRRHDVLRLVQGLRLVFQTTRKIEVLKYVRYFLSDSHIAEFDRLTNFHWMFRPRRRRHRRKHRVQDDRLSVSNTSMGTSSRTHRDVRVFTIQREPDEPNLGFSVRGGSEHGLGLYISEIDEGSVAEKSGLAVGDKLLEVNNISVIGAASSSAVKVLTGSNRLKLVVQRTHKIPEWRLSKEKTSWYDVHDRKLISGDFEECGMTHFIRGLDVDVPERRVNLKFGKNDKTLGFNVRGGKEYGLGIYVSKVDKNGLAEKNGVRVGDQIIDVNGVPFDNITHVHAVEVLKDKKHLILTLRDVGRFPAYKELYAEYTWSNRPVRAATSMTGLTDIHIKSDFQVTARTRSSVDLFSRKPSSALQSEIFLPAEQTNRLKVESDSKSDDSESLLDFETLANEIYADGTDNPGYESDTNFQSIVMVHADETEKKTEVEDTHFRKRTVPNSSDFKEYDDVEQIQKKHTKGRDGATTPEQLYAKIDKKKIKMSENVVNSNLSEPEEDYSDSDSSGSGKVKQYNVTYQEETNVFPTAIKSSLHSRRDSIHEMSPEHEENGRESKTEMLISQKSSVQVHRNIFYEKANDSENIDIEHISGSHLSNSESDKDMELKEADEKKFQGALYSQIRRLSAGSLSACSLKNSQENLAKTRSRESIYDDVTLQIRKTDRAELKEETKDMSQRSEDNIDNPYAMFADSDSDIISDEVDETFVKTDINFSMQKIDETITDLEKRQMTLGEQELNMLDEYGHEDPKGEDNSNHKNTKWRTFKNMIKGSLRMKSSKRSSLTSLDENTSSSPRRKGLFEKNSGIHSLHRNSIDGYNMVALEESARRVLSDEDCDAVLRNVKTYHDRHELQPMVDKLLAILDKPEKILLLKDVRDVIYPLDMSMFDDMVKQYEVEAYEKLSMKLHLPLNHDKSRKPRRRLVTTELGERGYFQLRPYGNQEKDDSKSREKSQVSPRRRGSHGNSVVRSASDHFEHLDSNITEHGGVKDAKLVGADDNDGQNGAVIVHLSKTKNNLGLELCDKNRPDGSTDILVGAIEPGSAADDDSVLQVGMTLLSVDNHTLVGCTVEEAEAVLQKSYAEKRHVSMKLALLMPEEWTTM